MINMTNKKLNDYPKYIQNLLKQTSLFDKKGNPKSIGEITANYLDHLGWDQGYETGQPGKEKIALDIGIFKGSADCIEDVEEMPADFFGMLEKAIYIDSSKLENELNINEYKELAKSNFLDEVKKIGGNVVCSWESSIQAIPQCVNGKTSYIYIFKCSFFGISSKNAFTM